MNEWLMVEYKYFDTYVVWELEELI